MSEPTQVPADKELEALIPDMCQAIDYVYKKRERIISDIKKKKHPVQTRNTIRGCVLAYKIMSDMNTQAHSLSGDKWDTYKDTFRKIQKTFTREYHKSPDVKEYLDEVIERYGQARSLLDYKRKK